jgi:heat shock protein HtpX
MQARRHWYRDSGLSVRMFFTMFMLAVVYAAFIGVLIYLRTPIIFIALVMAGLGLFQYFFSDKIVLASMGAREVTPAQAPELHAMVERLAAVMDLPKPKVGIMDTDVPNAFATGRNPQNAVVVCTTGIMRMLSERELQAVLGHELAHVKNRDVAVITWASFFATAASFIVQWMPFLGMGGNSDDRNAGLKAFLVAIVTWLLSFLLIRALSRYRELAADRASAVFLGDPQALGSALMKISGQMQRIPDEDLRRVEGANAFFIIPAINGRTVTELFSTHPSLETRLAQLQQIQRQMEGVT